MLKSNAQTLAFSASTKEKDPLKVRARLTDNDVINSISKNSEIIITIIGDGSKTSLQVIDAKSMTALDIEYNGIITSSLLAGSANISNVGFPEAYTNLNDLLKRLSLSKIGTTKSQLKDFSGKGIISGIAGLVANADKKPNIIDLFSKYGFDPAKIYLGGDVDLAKQLIKDDGAILISGTGSICFSKVGGVEKRVGGFGYALGDEGSGFYIGKLALQAALKSKFENKNAFILTNKLCEIFNLPSIDEAIKLFYNGTLKPGDVAKAMPLVFAAAFEQNDAHCKEIIKQAAVELADHINRAVLGSKQENFPIYLIGDVFKTKHAAVFTEMIRQKVTCLAGVTLINVADENMAVQVIASQTKMTQRMHR